MAEEDVWNSICCFISLKDKLNEDIPLPKPDTMTLGQIVAELKSRNLSMTGSRQELNERLKKDDLSKCRIQSTKI